MGPFALAQGLHYDSSPFVTVSTNSTETPVSSLNSMLSEDIDETTKGAAKNAPYTLQIQSKRFYDDDSAFSAHKIKKLLKHDLFDRITEIGVNLAGTMFPDSALDFL
jgi:hypothetical protein